MIWTHRGLLLLVALVLTAPASAEGSGVASPEEEEAAEQAAPAEKYHPWDGKDLSIDVGAGLLEFFHADLTYLHSRRWTIGVGLGFFPVDAVLRKLTGLEGFHTEADIEGFTVRGEAKTQLVSGALFTRWYPWKQTFYLELSLAVWTLAVMGEGTVSHAELDESLQVTTTARVWVPMIGARIGWRFYFQVGLYIDLGLGLNVLLAPDANVKIEGATAEELQAVPEVAQIIEDARRYMTDSLQDGANAIPDAIPAFPTIYLRIGWAIDFNPR